MTKRTTKVIRLDARIHHFLNSKRLISNESVDCVLIRLIPEIKAYMDKQNPAPIKRNIGDIFIDEDGFKNRVTSDGYEQV